MGASPVFRATSEPIWRNGRRARLKIEFPQGVWVRVPQSVFLKSPTLIHVGLDFSRVIGYFGCSNVFHCGVLQITNLLRILITTFMSRSISINKDEKSPFWFASFIGADGKQKRRSTKVPHAGGMYQGEKLSKAQAEKRALRVAYELARVEQEEYEAENNMSVREACDIMLGGKLGRVSPATYENAAASYRQFCAWLGAASNAPARLITRAKMNEWAISRRVDVRQQTARKDLAVIKSVFRWLEDSRIIKENPCNGVRIAPDTASEKVVHEAFTEDEVRLLLEKLPDEWSSAVRCCIGTYGQRMGDILSLQWSQFDWQASIVRMVTGKTRTALRQPMKQGFYDWARARYLQAQEKGGEAAVWVHPRLRLHSNPSGEFTQLVRLHGIGLVGEASGGNRRTWHSKTFHCLRASVVTMLHAAGVTESMAKRLVGHESSLVHAIYLRPTAGQLADAADNLPEF